MTGNEIRYLDKVSIRMVKDAPLMSEHAVRTPEDAINVIGHYLSDMDREIFMVLNLMSDGKPINCNVVSQGAVNYTFVRPADFIKSTVLSNAASVIAIHNHPSGSLSPSAEDLEVTRRLINLCNMTGVNFLDHVIIGTNPDKYYSIRKQIPYMFEDLNERCTVNERNCCNKPGRKICR